MGSTVYTDVKAMQINLGSFFPELYVLYPYSYEKNVIPHSSTGCAMYIGTYEECMQYAINTFVSNIPGGSAQGFSVNGMVKKCHDALCSALVYEENDIEIEIDLEKESLYSVFESERYDAERAKKHNKKVIDVLNRHGIDIKELGKAKLSLAKHYGLFKELNTMMGAWRFLTGSLLGTSPVGSKPLKAGFAPDLTIEPVIYPSPTLKAVRRDYGDGYYFKVDREIGASTLLGLEYDVLSAFLSNYQFSTLNNFKADFKALNQALKQADFYKTAKLEACAIKVDKGWRGSEEFNEQLNTEGAYLTGQNEMLFLDAVKRGAQVTLSNLETEDERKSQWLGFEMFKKQHGLKNGTKIETKEPIEIDFGDGYKPYTKFKKVSFGNKRNVWVALECSQMIRIKPALFGSVRLLVA